MPLAVRIDLRQRYKPGPSPHFKLAAHYNNLNNLNNLNAEYKQTRYSFNTCNHCHSLKLPKHMLRSKFKLWR
jgi:hypothetical protein